LIFNNLTVLDENASIEEKVQWLKINNHWCAKPFHTLQVQANTLDNLSANPCCNHNPSEFLQLPEQQFSALKADIAMGVRHKSCETCWKTEITNDFSERVRDMMYWSPKEINNFISTGVIKNNEFNLGIKFSNFCNLACRSCSSGCSSTYAMITQDNTVSSAVSTDISQNATVWKSLLDLTKRLTETYEVVRIGMIGGETMIQKGATEYIKYLITLPRVNKIVLTATSNFTTLDPIIFEHMNKFRRLDLTASIDSTGDNYHYVRWPAQFSKIQNNLEEYIRIRQSSSTLTTLNIASVFGLNNIFYINEYLDFLHACLKKQSDITINVLHLSEPRIISIENLPVKYRARLLEYIQLALHHPVLTTSNAVPMKIFLQGVEQFLNTDRVIHSMFNNFLKFTADFDCRTNCNFEKFNQRLYEVLDTNDQLIYQNYLNTSKSLDQINNSQSRNLA
jgi:hypothetical protein